MQLARFSIQLWTSQAINQLVAEMQQSHGAVKWSRSARQAKPWLSRGNSILTAIIFLTLCLAFSSSPPSSLCLSVFHPVSRPSDKVCPTGQAFSSHHAHHFLSSFPLVCVFHLLWPVHSPSSTTHKLLFVSPTVRLCVACRNWFSLYPI